MADGGRKPLTQPGVKQQKTSRKGGFCLRFHKAHGGHACFAVDDFGAGVRQGFAVFFEIHTPVGVDCRYDIAVLVFPCAAVTFNARRRRHDERAGAVFVEGERQAVEHVEHVHDGAVGGDEVIGFAVVGCVVGARRKGAQTGCQRHGAGETSYQIFHTAHFLFVDL